MKNAFSHLLSPGRIGTLQTRNRIAVTAMGASFAEEDGYCGERIIRYHEEQAKGGVGLIITGVAGVAWPVGGNQKNQIAISDDKFLPGLNALTEAVHKHGAKIAAQLHHGGLVAVMDSLAGRPLWVPSEPEPSAGKFLEVFLLEELAAAPFSKIKSVSFKVMTVDDIKTVIDQFAAAAVRAQRAGFDGVEIHGGHGYLLSSFLSPTSNRRTDEYGGALENRARFLLDVIHAVRSAVGPDFPVWCKLDSREVGKQGGITIDDAIATAKLVEAAGVDAITVTAYHDPDQPKEHSGSHTPHVPALNLPYAAKIKAALKIPVIASGRIEPDEGDKYIADGSIDFVSMGRKLLADPHLPRKLTEGRADDVLPCIYCYTCISAIYAGDSMRCAVNPETGFEYLRHITREGQKRIVVIGGGPGGMEAARRLDDAGHRVVLIEQSDRLGGTLRIAALAYPANERLLNWLHRQIEASRVDVRLNTKATPELLAELKPDAVVVATGALRTMPPLPGNDQRHVFSGDDMRKLLLGESSSELQRKTSWFTRVATVIGAASGLTAHLEFVRTFTRYWMPIGKRIVIIGGELVGLELAEFLSERGRRVSVIEEAPRLGAGLTIVRRMRLLEELKEHGLGLHAGVSSIRIDSDSVLFVDANGKAQAVDADQVIVAKGATGNLALADALKAQGFNVHTVGDCNGVGYIEGSMRGAAQAAYAISNNEPSSW